MKEDNKRLPPRHEEKNAEMSEELLADIGKIIQMVSMQRISGRIANPVISKITEKHIDKVLELLKQEEENSYKGAQSTKRYSLIYF